MLLVAAFVLDDAGASPDREFTAGAGERSLTIVGDIGSDEAARRTLAGMAEADPTAHVALGHLSYAGPGSEQAWCDLISEQLEAPVAVVAGNHEEDTGEDGRIANFEKCLPDRLGSRGLLGVPGMGENRLRALHPLVTIGAGAGDE
jgi:hypothetical protein